MKIFALSRTLGYKAGYEKSFVDYLRVFQKLSHEVTVFYEDEGLIPPDLEFRRYRISGLCVTPKQGKIPEIPTELLRHFEEESPGLLFMNHVQQPHLMEWAGSLKKCRTVRRLALHDLYCLNGNKVLPGSDRICPYSFGWRCVLHTYLDHCGERRPDRLFHHFSSVRTNLQAARRLSGMVTPSRYMRQVLIYNGIPAEKIYYIPPFCAPSEGACRDDGYMLFVGRIVPSKGLDWVLRALVRAPASLKLVVIGDGPTASQSEKLAQELGLENRVEFKGFASPDVVRDYGQRCSFVVFPSVWEEPAGIVTIEAAAWGKPVIAFRVGGVPDFVKDGINGFLVPRKDLQALAERIALLSEDEGLRKRMGTAGRNFALQELGAEHFEKRIALLLETLSP